jgi:hypothetical protein
MAMNSPRIIPGIPYRMTTTYQLPSLRSESKDWLISATDPFHDFEHPIEGAPDDTIGKSFTRLFTQTATISAANDDDQISIVFYGHHGADSVGFYNWGVDGYCDASSTPSVPVHPITAYRSSSARVPCLTERYDGNATVVLGMGTCQNDLIPSRLVSLGLEIVDTTPALYKKGTIHVNHMSGVVEESLITRLDASETPVNCFQHAYRKPLVPTIPSALVQLPGSYTNAVAKGAYIVGRINKISTPARTAWTVPAGSVTGTNSPYPILSEVYNGKEYWFAPSNTAGLTWQYPLKTWRDSGFSPFVAMLTGLAETATFQVTVKTTVEYFPGATHLLECGLATNTPIYEPDAFRIYHEIMRQMPSAVPVSFNAAGDYWRMLVAAARRVVVTLRTAAPVVGAALQAAGAAAGNPLMSAAGQAVSLIPPPRPKRPLPKAPQKRK